jgi:pimeloyl-ACP methyl ester carboxylesterase
MGAAVTLAAALRSQAVKGLVLLGAGSSLPVAPEFIQLSESRDIFQEAVERMLRGSFSRETDPRFIELARERMQAVDPAIFHLDFVACSHFDVRSQLDQIVCPALVICGEADRMTPPAQNEALAQELPQGEFFVVQGAGHMVMLEKPEAVAGKLAAFLDSRIP